jgi:N-carbamoyl-L-amino-acid hydrolase
MMEPMTTQALSIGVDAPRFWSTVMRSGEIGPGKAGGLRRLALSDADKEMRDLFIT